MIGEHFEGHLVPDIGNGDLFIHQNIVETKATESGKDLERGGEDKREWRRVVFPHNMIIHLQTLHISLAETGLVKSVSQLDHTCKSKHDIELTAVCPYRAVQLT